MTVDVKLLTALALPLTYLFALIHLLLWFFRRQRTIHLWWAAVNLCGAAGVSLLIARGVFPLWVSTSLGNTVIVAASLILWASMARFAGHTVPILMFVIATVVFFGLFQGLWSMSDDLGLRVLLASLASAAINAGIAWELLRAQQRQTLRTRTVLSGVFAVHGMFFLFRAATAVTLDASQDFLQATGIQNIAVATTAIKLIIWNLGAMLMMREQARASPTPDPQESVVPSKSHTRQ